MQRIQALGLCLLNQDTRFSNSHLPLIVWPVQYHHQPSPIGRGELHTTQAQVVHNARQQEGLPHDQHAIMLLQACFTMWNDQAPLTIDRSQQPVLRIDVAQGAAQQVSQALGGR